MSIRSIDYALLSSDCYIDRKPADTVVLGGVAYKVLAVANDPSGYQATAYQRFDTAEVVIANRGTEFFKEPYRDVIQADGGMVRTGVNSQLDDAMVFANQVRGKVLAMEREHHRSIPITVTGHSLGGTLAEIQSYRFGFHGETFNAYGAAGLAYGVPEGGSRIINNVVATDAVSAASAHFGEVCVYASAQNIADMEKAGYGLGAFPRSDANPLLVTGVQAHLMKNFLPGNDLTGESIMAPVSAARYRAHQVGIDQLRTTIMEDRKVLSGDWAVQGSLLPKDIANRKARIEGQLDAAIRGGVADTAVSTFDHMASAANSISAATRDTVGQLARNARQAVQVIDTQRPIGSWMIDNATTTIPRLNHPSHPDHAMYLQAREGVHALDVEHQRIPDQRSDQLAAALVVAARQEDLDRINRVTVGQDKERVAAWQLAPPGSSLMQEISQRKFASVPTVHALNTPIEHSSQAWEQAMQKKQAEQAQAHTQQMAQQHEQVKQASHGRAR